MRRFLAVAFALFALLLFTPQAAVAAQSENDALDVTTEFLQPTQAVAVQADRLAMLPLVVLATALRGEPCATARQRPAAPFTATVAPFTDWSHVYADNGSLLLDHRWTLRAATGRIAAGVL